MTGYAANCPSSPHICYMLMIFSVAEAKKKKSKYNPKNSHCKHGLLHVTHGYMNNYFLNLTYFLQETTDALYTYYIMQFSSDGTEKPGGFAEGDKSVIGKPSGFLKVKEDGTGTLSQVISILGTCLLPCTWCIEFSFFSDILLQPVFLHCEIPNREIRDAMRRLL